MEQGAIKKEDLKKLIAAVTAEGTFYGPAVGSWGVTLSELGPADELVLDYANFMLPPKRCLFPQSEVIITSDGESVSEAPLPAEKSVIFGVRPCDAVSFLHLEKVFLDEQYGDPYYRARRDNAVIISLACNEPLDTCFCTSVGGDPAGSDGADIVAFDVGNALLFETATSKGEDFMKAHATLFRPPTAEETKTRHEQAAAAAKKMPAVSADGITENLKDSFDSPVWNKIAERCLGCGVCTYLCPTCHCFGIYDEEGDAGGRRIRAQDSCLFTAFTLEASGHNPRKSHGERMRQRIMHKFRYTAENFGHIFCVGCGRCITHCPVNIDLRETIAEVNA